MNDPEPVILEPCELCGFEFDQELLGRYGCPNCHGDGLESAEDVSL